MGKGWDATGLLQPLWQQLEGKDKRGQLAELSDVRATELSSHNTGKPLGPAVAQKIIEGFAKEGINVSVLELGAPVEEADEKAKTFLDLLAGLQTAVSGLEETVDLLDKRLLRLEKRRGGGATPRASTGP